MALCDINEHISCSKVFTSKYGKGFGLIAPVLGESSFLNMPNSIYGLLFYSLQMYLCTVHSYNGTLVQLVTAAISLAGCAYLAFVLFFILEDVCVVCISTYVVNGLLFAISVWKWKLTKKKVDWKNKNRIPNSKIFKGNFPNICNVLPMNSIICLIMNQEESWMAVTSISSVFKTSVCLCLDKESPWIQLVWLHLDQELCLALKTWCNWIVCFSTTWVSFNSVHKCGWTWFSLYLD